MSITSDGRRLDSKEKVLEFLKELARERAASTLTVTEPKPPDVGRIVEALDRHGVEYLLVGGVAATAHGAERLTGRTGYC